MWELQATVAEYFQRVLWDAPGGQAAREYLASRDVSRSVAERFGMGFAPKELGAMRTHLNGLGYDDARLLAAGLLVKRDEQEEPRPRFRDRLMFPIHDASAHLVGFGGRLLGPGEPKYLNSSDSEIFQKGRILYNLHQARNPIRRDERAILVEGYFDALRLVAAGIECVVAPMGTALTEQQAEMLGKYSRQVFLLYDSDAPGQKATFRAADVLLSKGLEVRVVTLPEGEDPDTFVRTHGRAAVESLLERAMDVFDRKVQLLERAGWFRDLQHKRRALDRLLPTIRAATDPVTRDLYLARAAQAAGVAREVLLNELHAVRRGSGVRTASRPAGRAATPASDFAPLDESGGRGVPLPMELPAGPYRSEADPGNVEQTLIRVVLTQPMWQDQIIEELGKIEAEEMPEGADESDALGEDAPGVIRDPIYRAIYDAVLRHGADGDPERFTEGLSPLAVRVYEDLRGEKDAVVDARQSITDGVRKLRARSVEARIRSLESLLPLAGAEEKDQINVTIKRLTDEKRALGVQSWGSMRRR
jgi:DNA primase